MTNDAITAYEGLFLFSQSHALDLQAAVDHLKEILARAEVEIIALRKWDERRLAYEIKGNKRGLYLLAYFRARHDALTGIERDCNLSEMLLRSMVVRADQLTQEQMEAADGQAELADEIKLREAEAQPAAESSKPAAESSKPVAESSKPAVPGGSDEPLTVETEAAPKDTAPTEA